MGKSSWVAKVLPVVIAFFLIEAAFFSGCGPKAPSPEPPPRESPQETTPLEEVAVYYVKMKDNEAYLVREVHRVLPTGALPEAALQELITGIPATEGTFTIFPPETKIRSLKIEEGLATVDFSREVLDANVGSAVEALGIQSIVNTLTEFPGIEEVSFPG